MAKLLIITVLLFALELIYFKIGDHFNIIDKPNQRSSHTSITLRGGGGYFLIWSLAICYLLWISISLVSSRIVNDCSY